MTSKQFPEQGIRATEGIFRLAKDFGIDAMEKAAAIGVEYKLFRVRQIQDILKNRLYERPLHEPERTTVKNSENIRGQYYFNERLAS
jgi:hypothetical protein